MASKDIPWCMIFLVVGTLSAHTLVLYGNLATSRLLHQLGTSTRGWSNVGKSLANAMSQELDPAMTSVSLSLTQAITTVTSIQKSTDVVLSMSGATTDAALAQYNMTRDDVQVFKANLMVQLKKVTNKLLEEVGPLIDEFIEFLKPALDKIQEWLTTLGSQIQASLEQFGTTIDRVQKIFDQLMSQMSATIGDNADVMVYNTYLLFDTDKSGFVDAKDVRSVAQIYGIPAFSGRKAEELMKIYDADGKGGLNEQEYTLFVNDPSIPGVMSVMLRAFALKMAEIAGRVKDVRMRDEVAIAIADYFALIGAKNLTRLGWLCQTLVNGTLPIQFTADVLKEVSEIQDNPNLVSAIDVGELVFAEMMRLNRTHVMKVLQLVSHPLFWASEGFEGAKQPTVVKRIVAYIVRTTDGAGAGEDIRVWLASAMAEHGATLESLPASKDNVPELAFQVTKFRQERFQVEKASGESIDSSSLFSSSAAQTLRDQLLGGAGAAAAGQSQDAEMATHAGQKALPPTLLFAQWVSANGTARAQEHLRNCFDYSGKSSGALDSFAKEVNGMVSRIHNFINLMSDYASPKGVDRLLNQSKNFVRGAADDIVLLSEAYVDAQLAEIQCKLSQSECHMTTAQKDMSVDLTGAFSFITTTLHELKTVLPTVLKNLQFARQGVSKVSRTMDSVMQVLGTKGPPMLFQISKLYKGLWVSYFVFFGMLTVITLLYGFWASGYYGGPKASADEQYEPPRTFWGRITTCCVSCTACLRGCNDMNLFFWSVILLAEVVALALFLISVVICIIAGVQAFVSAGCSQIYILGDNTICTGSLNVIRIFLKTFWKNQEVDIDETCGKEMLMTCKLISDQMILGVKLSAFGGILAAVLSFQMIVDSAMLHERARWRRMFDAEAKKS